MSDTSAQFHANVDEILEQYSDLVYRVAYLQMGNPSDAQDVYQEVFLRLVRYKERLKCEEHVKPWLIRVTVNCCKKQFSSAWRQKTVAMEEDLPQENEELEERSDVLEAVIKLPKLYRETIYLFYYEDYSVKEISQILKRSENTVKSQLSRGRALLKDTLTNEE